MDSRPAISSIILLSAIMALATANYVNAQQQQQGNSTDVTEFIRSSCKVTRYPQLCVLSLYPYAGSLEPRLSDLVKAAMNVSLGSARNVSNWATALKKGKPNITEEESTALDDCIDDLEYTTEQIQQSVTEIEQLKNITFKSQITDIQTYLSAALTNEDSCLDRFANAAGYAKAYVTILVQIESQLISNALALVNALAAKGGGGTSPL